MKNNYVKSLVCRILSIILIILLFSCDSKNGKQESNVSNAYGVADTTPVDIILSTGKTRYGEIKQEWHFKIPKSYLRGGSSKSNSHKVIRIKVNFPDLSPRLKKDNNQKALIIYLKAIKFQNQFRQMQFEKFENKYDRQSKNLYGLLHYLNKSFCHHGEKPEDKENGRCIDTGKEYLISENSLDQNWSIFECHRPDVSPGAGCTVTTNFKDILIDYIFPRDQLQSWREYDLAVKELLNKFYVKSIDNVTKSKMN